MPRRPLNFRTLDLNLLRVFDAVMAERHVTRAAERLAMSQPAVSNALRRLRESVQEELLLPTTTGVTPTPAALALWPAVRDALASLQQALAPQDFDAGRDERHFTLAMADATAALFVPALADGLAREHAQVALTIAALSTRDPRPQLERGEADAAIGFFPEAAPLLAAEGPDGAVGVRALYRCRYVAVLRREHPLAQKAVLTLDDYCAARHLRVSFAGRARGFADEALARLGRTRQVALTVSQFSTASAAVIHSDLLTLLPRSFVPASGFAAAVVTRELPFEMPPIEVSLLWHRRHELDSAHRWLRDRVGAVAAEIAGRLPVATATGVVQ